MAEFISLFKDSFFFFFFMVIVLCSFFHIFSSNLSLKMKSFCFVLLLSNSSFQNLAAYGNSLAVQWLGLCAFTAWVQSLVGELRSHKRHGVEEKKEGIYKPVIG